MTVVNYRAVRHAITIRRTGRDGRTGGSTAKCACGWKFTNRQVAVVVRANQHLLEVGSINEQGDQFEVELTPWRLFSS